MAGEINEQPVPGGHGFGGGVKPGADRRRRAGTGDARDLRGAEAKLDAAAVVVEHPGKHLAEFHVPAGLDPHLDGSAAGSAIGEVDILPDGSEAKEVEDAAEIENVLFQ